MHTFCGCSSTRSQSQEEFQQLSLLQVQERLQTFIKPRLRCVMLLILPLRYKVGATQGVLFLQDVNWGHGFILQTAEHGHALHTKLAKKWHWSNHIPYVAPLPRPVVFIQWGKGCGVAYGPSSPVVVHHGEKVAGLCAELCVRVRR